jgi:hypothetical protein
LDHLETPSQADIGAGSYGIWASRAAKAFVRRADPALGCQLLLVEPFVLGDQRLLQQHLARNFQDHNDGWLVLWNFFF